MFTKKCQRSPAKALERMEGMSFYGFLFWKVEAENGELKRPAVVARQM